MSIEYGIKNIEFIKGEVSQLDVFESVKLGLSLGETLKSGRVGVGFADDSSSKANAMALMAALSSQKINVWNFGTVFLSKLSYLTLYSCLSAGLFVDSKRGSIILLGSDGITVNKNLKSTIESNFNSLHDFSKAYSNIFDMSSLGGLYYKTLNNSFDSLKDVKCTVKSSNPQIELLMSDILDSQADESLVLRINKFGTGVSVYTKETGLVPFKRLLSICDSWEQSRSNSYSDNNNSKSASALLNNDGLFTSLRILNILKSENISFLTLNSSVPDYYTKRKVVNIKMNKDIYKNLKSNGFNVDSKREDILRLKEGRGVASIMPLDCGKTGVLTQCASDINAENLITDIEKILENQYF